jgi:hypothetical protein
MPQESSLPVRVPWSSLKRRMPGVLLKKDRLAEAEIAYSVERVAPDSWALYEAERLIEGKWSLAEVRSRGIHDALGLYRELDELACDLPLEWKVESTLGLPGVQELYWDRVRAALPGEHLGSANIWGSTFESRVEYSVTWNGKDDAWNLHWCGEGDHWLNDPDLQTDWSHSADGLVETLEEAGFDGDEVRATIQQLRNDIRELSKIRLDGPVKEVGPALRRVK